MKKIIKSTVALFTLSAMMFLLLAGCRNDVNDDTPGNVFIPEYVPIENDIGIIDNLFITNDIVYFSSTRIINEKTYESETKLFSMDINDPNPVELLDYSPDINLSDIDPPVDEDSINNNIIIMALYVCEEGYLWVVETGYFWHEIESNSFDSSDNTTPQETEPLGSVINLRKIDNTGAELLTVRLNHLHKDDEFFYITSLIIDEMGNIYLTAPSSEGTDIYVLYNNGSLNFKLNSVQTDGRLFKMHDDSISLFTKRDNGFSLSQIDYYETTWGAVINFPYSVFNIYAGNDDFDLLYVDNMNLYGLEISTGERAKLLSLGESNIALEGLKFASLLPDERIMIIVQTWDMSNPEIIFFTSTPYSDLPERTVLTLAGFGLWGMRGPIEEFNRMNPSYRIHATDYTDFSTDDDWFAGNIRLTTEIISGRVPDIIYFSGLPFELYARKGLLVDLYPFIDSDPELSRDSFIENILRKTEIDGNLYMLFSSFSVNTVTGNPDVLGENPGWTMDEFVTVLNANPQADIPIGKYQTKENILRIAISYNSDEYIDWSTGTVNFDTDAFIEVLKFANSYPADFDLSSESILPVQAIISGRMIMDIHPISSFRDAQIIRSNFGGDIVFKGFPTGDRSGISINPHGGLAITTTSNKKEGAWEFLRTLHSKDVQLNSFDVFPTNRVLFNEVAEAAMVADENDTFGLGPKPMTRQELDQVLSLIDSATSVGASWDVRLLDIVLEGASDFFNGRGSVQDAARIIQNRASIFMAEQN